MPRWQALLALVAVSAGSVLLAAGPAGLAHVGNLVWGNIGWLLIGLGSVALLLTVAPNGAVVGPLALVVAGLVAVGWPRPEIWALTGGVLAATGAFLLLGRRRPNHDPVMRHTTVVFPRWLTLSATETCPDRLFVQVAGGLVEVDVTTAATPGRIVQEVLVTCWGGWVRIKLPDHWAVVGGRLAATPAISLRGALDSEKSYPDPGKITDAELAALTDPRSNHGKEPALMVVHVMGLGGGVRLNR